MEGRIGFRGEEVRESTNIRGYVQGGTKVKGPIMLLELVTWC
jgi:hypothetical protein